MRQILTLEDAERPMTTPVRRAISLKTSLVERPNLLCSRGVVARCFTIASKSINNL